MNYQEYEMDFDDCRPYSEFNDKTGYDEYLRDLRAQQESGIICPSLARKAIKQGRDLFYFAY